jgi:MFS family permease
MVGATGGTLVGGWFADRSTRHFAFIVGLTFAAAALLMALGTVPMPDWMIPLVAAAAGLAMGASRTPRDVMLKEAVPPGQMGKVFGFVSSGLPLGGAITPVPFGFLIDIGLAWLVLPLTAALLLASLLCMGGAAEAARRAPPAAPLPAE